MCACDDQLDEVYSLLYNNYVEDDDNMFRFDYSRDFLKWYGMLPHSWTGHALSFQLPARVCVVHYSIADSVSRCANHYGMV